MQTNYRALEAIHKKFGTQAVFAHRVKRSPSFVSEVVTGKRKLDDPTITEWAMILDIDESILKDPVND